MLRGDFGPSYRTKDFTVTELLAKGAPASFKVGGLAVVLAILLGMHAGIIAALRQNSWVDYSVMSLAMVGIAIPSFVMAPLLTLIFGVYLGWLPAGGWGGGAPQFLILPVMSLAPAAGRARRAPDARRHDRAAARELCPHRARQGPARADLVVLRHALPGAHAAGGLLSRADDRSRC